MIAFLKGILVGKTLDKAYIDVSGVGYEVGMSQLSLSNLAPVGQSVQIHTYLQVREDAMTLYGFTDIEEKVLFLKLTGVSGVGPKVALAALSTYAPSALMSAITLQDTAAIGRIPGVGKKTASRIALELKDAFDAPTSKVVPSVSAQQSTVVMQVQEALLSMGFTSVEAELALQGAPEKIDEGSLLQYALKRLGKT